MYDEIVKPETAQLAHQKGFNIPEPCSCGGYPECVCEEVNRRILLKNPTRVYRPTQSLLQKWLHAKGLILLVEWDTVTYGFSIYNTHAEDVNFFQRKYALWDAYDAALEAGLVEALNLLPD